MSKLDFIINQGEQNSITWFDSVKRDINNLKKMALNFRFLEIDYAIKCISQQDYLKSKQHFFTASLLDELRINKFNDDQLSFGLGFTSYPILSDNDELIERYSKLRYQAWGKMPGMNENVLNGKSDIWSNTVQLFMANDNKGVERNLDIIESITLKKLPKNQQELIIDFDFFKALYTGNKSKIEEVLDKLLSPKIHKKRNINDILAQYISLPALGYAKLAWRKGIEVEVNSPLVPKELLPIQPLDNYEIPYEFLKGNV